jgi:drug/metabolite transporter (DMT)-like permease
MKNYETYKERQATNYSNWAYIGYLFAAVGCALSLTGTIALYSLQQSSLLNTKYSAYFLPILIVGIIILGLCIVAFVKAGQKEKHMIPPPPFPEPPPPLPPFS